MIDAAFAPTVSFQRPNEDDDGNASWSSIGDFPVIVDLTGPGFQSSSGTATAQGGTVFVPRGSPLLIGDRFAWGGGHYMLSGGPNGDQDHPMTGENFGWVSYAIIGQLARWGTGTNGR